MATNRFVKSVVSTAPSGASVPGFGTPMFLSYNADFFGVARTRSYASMDGVEEDWASGTVEHSVAKAFFAADITPDLIVIGRGANKPTLIYSQSLATVSAGSTYEFPVGGTGVTSTTVSVVAGSSDLTISTVTAGTDQLTVTAHGQLTGAGPFYLTTTGALPAATPALAANTPYWLVRVDDNNVSLATSLANAIAGTIVDITSAGTGTHTIVRTGNDVLVERIVSGLNSVADKNYLAAVVGVTGSKTWTVTGASAGNYFFVGVDHNLVTSAVTNVDPDIDADLTAIRNANAEWYELHTAYNSTATVLAAASWVSTASDDLAYHPSISATVTVNAAVGTAGTHDVADQLKTLANQLTACWYHPNPGMFLAEAVAGRMLPTEPGESEYFAKQLRNVTPVQLTDTQRVNLEAKNANSYQVVQQTAVTFLGKVAAGEWISVVRNNAYANADLQVSLWNSQLANEKIPMTPDGVSLIKNVVLAWMTRMTTEGIYRNDVESQPKFDFPTIKKLSAADRTARKYGLKWSAQLVGAIVYLEASGTVFP